MTTWLSLPLLLSLAAAQEGESNVAAATAWALSMGGVGGLAVIAAAIHMRRKRQVEEELTRKQSENRDAMREFEWTDSDSEPDVEMQRITPVPPPAEP